MPRRMHGAESNPAAAEPPNQRNAVLARRGVRLEWTTIAWNSIEAAAAVASGIVAHSIVLVAFGLDSAIEIFAATVTLWDLQGIDEERERRATRLVALSLFTLSLYVTVEAIISLSGHAKPEASTPGIVISAVALVVMPLLGLGKRRVGHALGNSTLLADSAESFLCAAFAAVALIGVSLNVALGWWWADPVAALVLVVLVLREGREAWTGEAICAKPTHG